MYAKHFELNDETSLADLAFKGILLGGARDIDLHQFMPQRLEVLKQLIFLIGQIDPVKAHLELQKIDHVYPQAIPDIKNHLKAS
jgi:hypothetical protein